MFSTVVVYYDASYGVTVQVMVVPEGAEAVSRPSPDYPMLPTIPLSAFSDPKKTKTSHVSKVGPLHTYTLVLSQYQNYRKSAIDYRQAWLSQS